jgi:hypothetical protein
VNYLRWWTLPRRRLNKVLSAQGIDFVKIAKGGSYGWPGYIIVFDAEEKRRAFEKSPAFEALLREVQDLHGKRPGFDARKAVWLEPFSLPEAS